MTVHCDNSELNVFGPLSFNFIYECLGVGIGDPIRMMNIQETDEQELCILCWGHE